MRSQIGSVGREEMTRQQQALLKHLRRHCGKGIRVTIPFLNDDVAQCIGSDRAMTPEERALERARQFHIRKDNEGQGDLSDYESCGLGCEPCWAPDCPHSVRKDG